MAKYDDASWHYEGTYPEDLPNKNAATHIGMFLDWCINNDLLSKEQMDDSADEITSVKSRIITGAEFLITACDEKFVDENLSRLGNRFAKAYYEYGKQTKFGKAYANYLNDYSDMLANGVEDDVYYVADTWKNYDKLSPIIDRRFVEWQDFTSKKK